MTKRNDLPTLEADDERPTRRHNRKRGLPPFVILKRGLAIFAALFGVAMMIAMSVSPDTGINGRASEDTQIFAYILAAIPIAVGAWLWGGRDPD